MAKLAKRRIGPPVDSENLSGLDPITQALKRRGIPVTRKNWLSMAGFDEDEPLPEDEASFPDHIRWKGPR